MLVPFGVGGVSKKLNAKASSKSKNLLFLIRPIKIQCQNLKVPARMAGGCNLIMGYSNNGLKKT